MMPVLFIAALAPPLALAVLALMPLADLTWGAALGLFYLTLALAQLGYLAALMLSRGRDRGLLLTGWAIRRSQRV